MSQTIAGKRLRLLWSDLLGVDRGKYLYGSKAEGGHTNFAMPTFVTMLDRTILPVSGFAQDVGLPDMQARCDTSSVRPGWEADTFVGLADLSRAGEPLSVDPRQVLRRACTPWIEAGFHPQLAFELEFYLLHAGLGNGTDERGELLPLEAPAPRVYGTGPLVDPDGVLDDIALAALNAGMPLEGFSSEFDHAQYELNLGYRDAIAAADDAFLARVLVREVAARRGYRATFLGKPLRYRAGTGMHVNLSFRTARGDNALWEPKAKDGLSTLAQQCIGGLMAHHTGVAAFCAPTVNAYRRLRPGQMTGYWSNWGYDDRTVAVRVPPERGWATRLEHRTPDGAANPYLVGAALLHAARFGVEQALNPPPPQPVGQEPSEGAAVPASLWASLDALAADAALSNALGADCVRAFTALKRAECDRYAKAVPAPNEDISSWELSFYLPFF